MFRTTQRNVVLIAAAVSLAAACSAGGGDQLFTTSSGGGSGGDGQGAGGSGSGAGSTGTGGEITIITGSGGGTTTGNVCNHPPDVDGDADGWTGAEGDCNDCDPNVNPGAIEVVAEDPNADPSDEDCDGTIDNEPTPCDDTLAIDDENPRSAAKAVELCKFTVANPGNKNQKTWGVLDARWVLPDGTDPTTAFINMAGFHLGHGMLTGLGPNVHVQGGQRMLGLSSGTARQPTDPGYQNVGGFSKGYTSGSPAGFPKESPACPGTVTGTPNDGTSVELQIRTPTNATGFTFDFNFFTYEWPSYVCSTFNDFFVALLSPIPVGQTDGNISFDKQGNPASVNNAFVEACGCLGGPPCQAGGKTFTCALGTGPLVGTGFGADTAGSEHASTGWLNTKAPVKGGETITIRWTVYDSGDGILDSTTLVDNWKWIANGGTVTVGTDPIGQPK